MSQELPVLLQWFPRELLAQEDGVQCIGNLLKERDTLFGNRTRISLLSECHSKLPSRGSATAMTLILKSWAKSSLNLRTVM